MSFLADRAMRNPKSHSCCDCGYTWRHGQHGGHSCVERLKQQIKDQLLAMAEMEAYDWDKLDKLTYSFDGRSKMKRIRNGEDNE